MIHDLQQHVEHVRVCLLDFIEQQHAVRLLGDGLGQQASLIEADITRRRTDQAADGVTLHVLAHVEADQLDAKHVGKLLGHLGLAHARRPGKQERADRLVGLAQTRASHLDRRRQRLDRRVLTEHNALEITIQALELGAVIVGHAGGRNARDLRHDLFHLIAGDGLLLLALGQDSLSSASFVNHVDRLVRQVTVVDEFRRQFCRSLQSPQRVLDAVVLFEARLQPLEDLHRLLDRRLGHIDLLEAARQRGVLFKNSPVLAERRRADALHRSGTQRRLEQVARVQRAAGCRTGADQGVDFINEQHGVGLFLERFQNAFEALLEIAAVLRAGQQRTHVQRINGRIGEHFRHVALGDAPCQTFGDRGLANASLAHEQGVVLASTAQDLNDTLDLEFAADERIDLSIASELVQVLRELVERIALAIGLVLVAFGTGGRAFTGLGGFGRFRLLDAVSDEIDDIEPGHALLVKVVDGV